MVRCFLIPTQLQDGPVLSKYTLASCFASMQNLKMTLNQQHFGILSNKASPQYKAWFSLWNTDSQELSSCWTKQAFHMGTLGKERLRPRFPNFLGTKPKSCWSAQRHLNKGFFHSHTGNLKWSTSSKIKINVQWINWPLLSGHTSFSQWCPNFSQCRVSAFHFGTHKCSFNNYPNQRKQINKY